MAPNNQTREAPLPHLPDEILTLILSFAIPDQVVRRNSAPLDYPFGLFLANRKLSNLTQHILSGRKLKIYINGTQPTLFYQHHVRFIARDAVDELRQKTFETWSKVPYASFQNIEIHVHPELACTDQKLRDPCHHPQMPFLHHMADLCGTTMCFSTLLRETLKEANVIDKTNVCLKLHNMCPFHSLKGLDITQIDSILPVWSQKSVLDVIKSFAWISRLTTARRAPEKAIQLPRMSWLYDQLAEATVQECESMLRSNLISAWMENKQKSNPTHKIASQPQLISYPICYWLNRSVSHCGRMVTSPPKCGFGPAEELEDEDDDDDNAWNTTEVYRPHSIPVGNCLQRVLQNMEYHNAVRRRESQILDKYFKRELVLVRKLLRAVGIDLLNSAQTKERLQHNIAIVSAACHIFNLLLDMASAPRSESMKTKGGLGDLRPKMVVNEVQRVFKSVIKSGLMGKEEFMEQEGDLVEAAEFELEVRVLSKARE